MKIWIVSDIHDNLEGFQKLQKKANKEEGLVLLGDFTYNGIWGARRILNSISSEWKFVLSIVGNTDPEETIKILEEKGISLHNKETTIEGHRFVGFGGGLKTGFYYVPLDEKKIEETSFANSIILSHIPPLNTEISINYNVTSIGCKKYTEKILKESPKYFLSGHIHEARGTCKLGNTICINPGPFKDGYCARLNLKNGKLEFLEGYL